MVWNQKTKLVRTICPLIVVILTMSAKRKAVVKMGEGRDMQVSMTTQIPYCTFSVKCWVSAQDYA